MGFQITKDGVLEKYTGIEAIVEIPDGVTKIRNSAFSWCRSLKEVVIPDSVKAIGNSAFYCCESLQEIVIPDSVIKIGNSAFSCCTSLKEVVIPNSVEKIGDYAFDGCSSLEKVVIPDSVKEIGDLAFYGCSSLKEITIPGSVEKIGSWAFSRCKSLKEITIPDGVTEVGKEVFSCCESLKEVVIPNSVTEIGESAFERCESLEKVVIPDSVTEIGKSAFDGCASLKEVVIPNSATVIGNKAFRGCTSLEKVVIPDSVTTIGNIAFAGCKSLKEIVIPDSVTKIGNSAFAGCESLKEIVIPDSVTKIGNSAFENCESLQDEQGFVIVNNILFDYYGKENIAVIPDSVKAIGNNAFRGCTSLKEIVIPDSVTTIGYEAFLHCKSLNEITIPIDTDFELNMKYNEYQFENLSDDLNKYLNQITNVLFYLDEEIKYDDLKYKIDMPNFPKINIRGYEDIEISDEDRKIILSEIKNVCDKDDRFYIPLAVFADDDTVNELTDKINVWLKGKKQDKERVMRVKGALMLNDTLAAQKYFEKIDKLELYAKKRNLDVDDLRDQVLSDFGLDENGQTRYVLEDKKITATLQNDLKFILTDDTGKVIKSISKKTDMGIKANEEYSKLKKDVKEAAKMTKDRMFKDFLNGKTRDGKSWKNIWLNNPVMKIMARLVVWQQDDNTFTLHDDNKPYLVDNTPYEITDKPVMVAHPLDMKDDKLIKWREYFVDNNLKQPFEQVWEPVIQPKDIKPDRYKDAYIPLYAIMNKDKHGIIMKGQSKLILQDCSAKLKLIEGHSDWINNQFEITDFRFNKYTRYVNHIVNIFDKGTVEGRIRKDDISVSMYLDRFTLAQITEFIDIATENKCTNVSALLLQYKQDHYPDYDVMDEFVLDL